MPVASRSAAKWRAQEKPRRCFFFHGSGHVTGAGNRPVQGVPIAERRRSWLVARFKNHSRHYNRHFGARRGTDRQLNLRTLTGAKACIIHKCRIHRNTIALISAVAHLGLLLEDGKYNLPNLKRPSRLSKRTRGRITWDRRYFLKIRESRSDARMVSKHLGLADKGGGRGGHAGKLFDDPQKEHVTVWTVFRHHGYFKTPTLMVSNYIVDDMDALLDAIKQEGKGQSPKRMDESYQCFTVDL